MISASGKSSKKQWIAGLCLLTSTSIACGSLAEDANYGASNLDENSGDTPLKGQKFTTLGRDFEWFAEFYNVNFNATSNVLVEIKSENHKDTTFYGVQLFKQRGEQGLAATLLLDNFDKARMDKYLAKKKSNPNNGRVGLPSFGDDESDDGMPSFGGSAPDDNADDVANLRFIDSKGVVGPTVGRVDGILKAALSATVYRDRAY
jgi:hypothetical protein